MKQYKAGDPIKVKLIQHQVRLGKPAGTTETIVNGVFVAYQRGHLAFVIELSSNVGYFPKGHKMGFEEKHIIE